MTQLGYNDDIRSSNNLYAKNMTEDFADIRAFLDKHPSEIVIIDLNGDWWDLDIKYLEKLEQEINNR